MAVVSGTGEDWLGGIVMVAVVGLLLDPEVVATSLPGAL